MPKYVGLLEVNGKNFRMQSIPLKTVRQLYIESITLADHISSGAPKAVEKSEKFCAEKVEEIIVKAGTVLRESRYVVVWNLAICIWCFFPLLL